MNCTAIGKAFYDLAFNQRQPEEAVRRYVGAFIGFVKCLTSENPELRVEFKRFIADGDLVVVHSPMIPAAGARQHDVLRAMARGWPRAAIALQKGLGKSLL